MKTPSKLISRQEYKIYTENSIILADDVGDVAGATGADTPAAAAAADGTKNPEAAPAVATETEDDSEDFPLLGALH